MCAHRNPWRPAKPFLAARRKEAGPPADEEDGAEKAGPDPGPERDKGRL